MGYSCSDALMAAASPCFKNIQRMFSEKNKTEIAGHAERVPKGYVSRILQALREASDVLSTLNELCSSEKEQYLALISDPSLIINRKFANLWSNLACTFLVVNRILDESWFLPKSRHSCKGAADPSSGKPSEVDINLVLKYLLYLAKIYDYLDTKKMRADKLLRIGKPLDTDAVLAVGNWTRVKIYCEGGCLLQLFDYDSLSHVASYNGVNEERFCTMVETCLQTLHVGVGNVRGYAVTTYNDLFRSKTEVAARNKRALVTAQQNRSTRDVCELDTWRKVAVEP